MSCVKLYTEEWKENGEDRIETPVQHAYIKNNHDQAVQLCNTTIKALDEDNFPFNYYDLDSEQLDESIICPACQKLSTAIENRTTEIQRAFDVSSASIKSIKSHIKEKQKILDRLKFDLIKEKSTLLKIVNKANLQGFENFL